MRAGGLLALLLACGCAAVPADLGPGMGPGGEALVMPPALPARALAVPAIAVPEAAAMPASVPEAPVVTPVAAVIAPAPPEPPAPALAASIPAAAPVAANRPAIAREGPQVQLVAAGSEAEARAHWSGFAQRLPDLAEGREPQILAVERPGQAMIWRLRVGGFADAGAAHAWCERLRARGGSCWVSG